MLISFTSVVSQVFRVFSMTSPEKDLSLSKNTADIRFSSTDVWLALTEFLGEKKMAHNLYFFFGQAIKLSCIMYTYILFKKSDYFACSSLHHEIFLESAWLLYKLIPFIHIFASGLSWHSLSERWWSYVVQMLSPLKSKFQENFLCLMHNQLYPIVSDESFTSALHQITRFLKHFFLS